MVKIPQENTDRGTANFRNPVPEVPNALWVVTEPMSIPAIAKGRPLNRHGKSKKVARYVMPMHVTVDQTQRRSGRTGALGYRVRIAGHSPRLNPKQ